MAVGLARLPTEPCVRESKSPDCLFSLKAIAVVLLRSGSIHKVTQDS